MLYLVLMVLLNMQPDVKPYAPELFPPTLSGAVCAFSADGKLIYFVREDSVANKLFMFQAEEQNGSWINEKLLSFSGQHNDIGGRLANGEKTFYITSDRPGGSDNPVDVWNIWRSELGTDGWSEPRPVDVNTGKEECCPTPLADGELLYSGNKEGQGDWQIYSDSTGLIKKLSESQAWQWPSYFDPAAGVLFLNSMKRPDTKGMDDVYVSFFVEGEWTSPVNIDAPVNTAVYEDGAILSPDGEWLIFNRHETHETPSRVLCVSWDPILTRLKIDR